jgi:hypothetical protein
MNQPESRKFNSIHLEPKIFQLDLRYVIHFMRQEADAVPPLTNMGSMHDGQKMEPGHLGTKYYFFVALTVREFVWGITHVKQESPCAKHSSSSIFITSQPTDDAFSKHKDSAWSMKIV